MILSKKMSLIALTLAVVSLAITAVVSATDWDGDGDDDGTYEEYLNSITTDTGILFGIGLTVCLVVVLVPLIIAILVCIWIYKDAEKRGKSGVLWFILLLVASLVGNFIGFIIVIVLWLATRPPIGGAPQQQQQGTGRMCTNCGRPIPMDAQVCPYCGKNFQQK